MVEFETAKNARDARWVQEALRRGDFGRISGVVPLDFEACVAILHPARKCICTADNLEGIRAGTEQPLPVRWSDVAATSVPVIYGSASQRVLGIPMSRPTQYRRLHDGGWIVEPIGGDNDLIPLIRIGDTWIDGPEEGSFSPDLALPLVGLLRTATNTPAACWFGLWDGFGFLSEAQRAGVSIAAPHRRWLLYRGAVEQLTNSFHSHGSTPKATGQMPALTNASAVGEAPPAEGSWSQSANLVWPEDRSWCLATEIDAQCTLIAGSGELISAIHDEPGLEVQAVSPDDRLPHLGNVLSPVVQPPPNLTLPPAFESRKYRARRGGRYRMALQGWRIWLWEIRRSIRMARAKRR